MEIRHQKFSIGYIKKLYNYFFSLLLLEDNEIKDSVIIQSDYYGMNGILNFSQKRQTWFGDQNDRAYNLSIFQYYQLKTPPLSKSQKVIRVEIDWFITKETILIKMMKSKKLVLGWYISQYSSCFFYMVALNQFP